MIFAPTAITDAYTLTQTQKHCAITFCTLTFGGESALTQRAVREQTGGQASLCGSIAPTHDQQTGQSCGCSGTMSQ